MPSLFNLHIGWTAHFESPWSPPLSSSVLSEAPAELLAAWDNEGIRLRACKIDGQRAQAVTDIRSDLALRFVAQRLKGRLSHTLRQLHPNAPRFHRSFFFRTLGVNTKDTVQHYIRSQVDASDLVDPLYRRRLKELQFHQESEIPWYNHHQGTYDSFAHVVFVTGGRHRMRCPEAETVFNALRDGAADIGNEAWEISIMPDHAHLLLRWRSDQSAASLIEDLKAASGERLRRSAFWSGGGYVGSVGPYRLQTAVARNRECGWAREGLETMKPLG